MKKINNRTIENFDQFLIYWLSLFAPARETRLFTHSLIIEIADESIIRLRKYQENITCEFELGQMKTRPLAFFKEYTEDTAKGFRNKANLIRKFEEFIRFNKAIHLLLNDPNTPAGLQQINRIIDMSSYHFINNLFNEYSKLYPRMVINEFLKDYDEETRNKYRRVAIKKA